MIIHHLIFILCFIIYLKACNPQVKEVNQNPLTGLWTLHIMEQRNTESDEWQEWREGMQGYLLYDGKDNMALHLTTKGYEKTDLRFPNFTDTISTEALKYLTNSYVYLGKYRVDEQDSIVEHTRISHSNPGDWGKVVQRRFSFKGDTLILKPVEENNANLRLKWLRKD